jgi:hypothetical protein
MGGTDFIIFNLQKIHKENTGASCLSQDIHF